MSRILASFVSAVLLCGAATPAEAHGPQAHEATGARPAQGRPSAGYAFPLPEPGTYRLPPIRRAGGGTVLDDAGQRRQLTDLLQGRITVLAFLYTRCGDICPTASLQLSRIQDMAAKDRRLAERIQLATMSFDPEHDTPAVMAEQAREWRSGATGAPPWHFLTAPDGASLEPILAAYDQTVTAKPLTQAGEGPLFHVFRAFLIDPAGQVRNIYSLDFLDSDLVLGDARTLLLEADTSPADSPKPRHQ